MEGDSSVIRHQNFVSSTPGHTENPAMSQRPVRNRRSTSHHEICSSLAAWLGSSSPSNCSLRDRMYAWLHAVAPSLLDQPVLRRSQLSFTGRSSIAHWTLFCLTGGCRSSCFVLLLALATQALACCFLRTATQLVETLALSLSWLAGCTLTLSLLREGGALRLL